MINIKKIKQLKNSAESLAVKYDMFYSNRMYKNTHFKTEDEYIIIQKNLSTEIEIEENNVKNILSEWFKINCENIKFLAFDSRFICINKDHHRIGKVLVKGCNDESVVKNLTETFNNDTDFTIIIEKYEDLPEELQKKFTF